MSATKRLYMPELYELIDGIEANELTPTEQQWLDEQASKYEEWNDV